ncbi:MAG: DUF1924 domain-containing protein [Rhodospirillales bacterium]|nr:DUF1924 domain-containing protein [Alphaproteobacteria bacterium]MBL6947404.1 DUF1924 domain-containing protein [Rhodospirillales bacterium]
MSPASASQLQKNIAGYASEAKARDKTFEAFSADRGRILFSSRPATGKPDTPSCTSCHTSSPTGVGQTRAGKEIAPLALSKTPDRYTNIKKVEKWFRRNCNSVLGRVCTALEKGDFLTFMIAQ